jgi:GTP-binding protein HflX
LIEHALDAADGAGKSWQHRHTEVISKTFESEGRAAKTVRVAPDKAEAVRAKFAPIGH